MRYFIFFYCAIVNGKLSFGNYGLPSETMPARADLVKRMSEGRTDGCRPENVSINGFNEVSKADYEAYFGTTIEV
jgi:hypothetical protein